MIKALRAKLTRRYLKEYRSDCPHYLVSAALTFYKKWLYNKHVGFSALIYEFIIYVILFLIKKDRKWLF